MFCPSSKQIRKGKERKEKKIFEHILKYLIFSKWLFYITATSTVYCHNEMLWGYILTSSSSTFDIKRESIGAKYLDRKHVRLHSYQHQGSVRGLEEPADNDDGSQDWYQSVTA